MFIFLLILIRLHFICVVQTFTFSLIKITTVFFKTEKKKMKKKEMGRRTTTKYLAFALSCFATRVLASSHSTTISEAYMKNNGGDKFRLECNRSHNMPYYGDWEFYFKGSYSNCDKHEYH